MQTKQTQPPLWICSLLIAAVLLVLNVFSSASFAQSTKKPSCLYVASYHLGNPWSDGVGNGLREGLQDQCELTEFYMDSKRHKSQEHNVAAAQVAYTVIKTSKPDIVITSDDNAAKYLIVPHLLDKDIPVVFSGINWTVEEYGFPASNVTGIVEIAHVKPLLKVGARLAKIPSDQPIRIAYLGAKTRSEIKDFNRIRACANALGMISDGILVESFLEWKHGFDIAQRYDLIVMGDSLGITEFDQEEASAWVSAKSKTLSLTNHEWMMPYTAIGFTKVAEEQGEWAAASAIAILNGLRTIDIPLVTNRRWDTWTNDALLAKLGIEIDQPDLINTKKFQ